MTPIILTIWIQTVWQRQVGLIQIMQAIIWIRQKTVPLKKDGTKKIPIGTILTVLTER